MPSDREPLVRLRGARLGYRRREVLSAVDLEVAAGEFWCVLGPNGSGKTTLLHTVLGLIAPLAGEVWRHPDKASLARVGFVPQKSAINPALPTSVREFVTLGRIGAARARADRAGDLAWALERVDLAGYEARDYWSLSGGQRQRALVARALARRPALLVLDEPTEGMDAASEESFLSTLEGLYASGEATPLFVTHNHHIAERHASHVALVWQGRVHAGEARFVLAGESMRQAYGSLRAHAGSAHPGNPGDRAGRGP